MTASKQRPTDLPTQESGGQDNSTKTDDQQVKTAKPNIKVEAAEQSEPVVTQDDDLEVEGVEATEAEAADSNATEQPDQDWSGTFEQLAKLPGKISEVTGQYGSQMKIGAALIAALVLLRLALALLSAIDSIPLMQPLLELVGLGYISWFVFQNLLTAESRQDLKQTVQNWKVRFLGE